MWECYLSSRGDEQTTDMSWFGLWWVCTCDIILQNGVKSDGGWVDLLQLYHSGAIWRRYYVRSSITIGATVTWKRLSLRGVVVVLLASCNCNVVVSGGTIQQWHYLLIYLVDQSTSFIHWEATWWPSSFSWWCWFFCCDSHCTIDRAFPDVQVPGKKKSDVANVFSGLGPASPTFSHDDDPNSIIIMIMILLL